MVSAIWCRYCRRKLEITSLVCSVIAAPAVDRADDGVFPCCMAVPLIEQTCATWKLFGCRRPGWLWRRGTHWAELGEDPAECSDPWREPVAISVDRIG